MKNAFPGYIRKPENEFAKLCAGEARKASIIAELAVEESAAEIFTWCNSG
jgi:hypothetical protein